MSEHIDRCPCGSGRVKDQCCGPRMARRKQFVQLSVIGALLLVGGALAALAIAPEPGPTMNQPLVTPSDPTMASTGSGAMPAIVNPAPWQYDPVTDKHWHADHGHWHPGRPPTDVISSNQDGRTSVSFPGANAENAPDELVLTGADGRPVVAQRVDPPPGLTGQEGAPTNIPNPEPWQYDPATDHHWHADHGHWHKGPPPDDRGG